MPARNPAASSADPTLDGAWEGVLEVSGRLRLVLNLARAADGSPVGTLDSPDQGARGIPVRAITRNGASLRFELASVGALFEGTIDKDGSAMVGTWKQSGLDCPLVFKRPGHATGSKRPQDPARPYPYHEEEVAYANTGAGVKLAGTLTRPRSAGPFPAVLLISGSGPQDRDETVMGHRPFLVLADHLTRRGIAVLRVDDRGVGGSSGDFAASTTEDFAADARAGVEYLKGRRDVDPRRVGLIGHSEGAIIAPMVAARSTVAFVVLLAGPGLGGEDILYLQAARFLKTSGASEKAIATNRQGQERMFAVLKNERDRARAEKKIREISAEIEAEITEDERKALSQSEAEFAAQTQLMLSPWFRFFLSHDPRPALRQLSCPVLAIIGERDWQVPPKENLAAIAEALRSARSRDHEVVELPGLNHLLQTCRLCTLAEYATLDETMAPTALTKVSDWILQRTRPRPDP